VDSQGIINTETLAEAVSASAHISLISIMTANNETGTLQPVKTAGMLAAAQGIPLHTDAVQAFGKIPLDLHEGAVSLCSISSHKIYGPKGCGALVVRKGAPLHSRTFGGGQEFGMRTGTQNLPAVLGFVKAAEVSCENMIREKQRLLELTEYLYHGIVSCIGGVVRNGHPEARIPGTLNLSFPGTTSGMIVHALDAQGICVSGGAACHAGSEEPSRILVAMGKRKQEAIAGVRFSLGRGNSKEEADAVIPILKLTVDSLRSVNS
jgi:cysteine desulfurase